MSGKFSMDDYIDVAERIFEFNKKYPEGTLQTISWETETIGDQLFIVYRAAAYRMPDDRRPGHGIAWEPFPGRTPYTKDSELMNAETAAWGRAIVACGLTSNRKIASRQEVKARATTNDGSANGQVELATADDIEALVAAAKGLKAQQVRMGFAACGIGIAASQRIDKDVFGTVPQAKTAVLAECLSEMEREPA